MKLFHFHDPGNNLFAKASRRGTWYPPGIKICPECSSSRQTRISPLIIEWEAGSDKIGDFTWPGFDTELVVVNTVKIAFKNKFTKIEFGVVTFFQNQNLRQPIKLTSRTKPRIWLPYPGPMLWDILPTHWCHIDHSKSGVSIEKKCSTCEKIFYKTPQWYQRNLVIDPTTWNGADIFHIYEYSGGIFCTEQVKLFVENAGFTNVSFLEDGVIPVKNYNR